nr:translation initiation factor IF-3, mitochondrial isoform X2 [Chlorocebus sabaeus]
MAALFLKRLTLQTVKSENSCVRCFGKHIVQKTAPAQSFPIASAPRLSFLIHVEAFSTVEDTKSEGKKKKKSQTAFGNIGRRIGQRIIHLFDEKGNDMGNMHRADVIRLMDERDLRLVQRNAGTEPAEYQLMTGMQILQERQRLREMKKASPKTGPTQTKELTFSSNIGQHDLDTKTKQIQQWIKKERQVRITIKKGKNVDVSENKVPLRVTPFGEVECAENCSADILGMRRRRYFIKYSRLCLEWLHSYLGHKLFKEEKL